MTKAEKEVVESRVASRESIEKELVDKEHEETPADSKVASDPEDSRSPSNKPAKAPKPPKMYKVRIAADDSPEGRSDVFIGLNFHSYLIQRDKEVTVPEGVVEILRNTVIDTKGENGSPIRIPRYNFSVEAA